MIKHEAPLPSAIIKEFAERIGYAERALYRKREKVWRGSRARAAIIRYNIMIFAMSTDKNEDSLSPLGFSSLRSLSSSPPQSSSRPSERASELHSPFEFLRVCKSRRVKTIGASAGATRSWAELWDTELPASHLFPFLSDYTKWWQKSWNNPRNPPARTTTTCLLSSKI